MSLIPSNYNYTTKQGRPSGYTLVTTDYGFAPLKSYDGEVRDPWGNTYAETDSGSRSGNGRYRLVTLAEDATMVDVPHVTCAKCPTQIANQIGGFPMHGPTYDDKLVICYECQDTGNYYRCYNCNTSWARRDYLITLQNDEVYCTKPGCADVQLWKCATDDCYVRNGGYCNVCYKDVDGNERFCNCSSSGPIHSYSCKPNLTFHGTPESKLFLGFELEMEFGRASATDASIYASGVLRSHSLGALKSDGSLDNGFELVTMPHSYEKYRDNSDVLFDVVEKLRTRYKARSWDTKTAGLHIHLSRDGFKNGPHTHRFIEFVYRNPEMLMKFAGRRSDSYASFQDCWYFDDYHRPIFDIEHKMTGGGQRMSAVNTNNRDTLELRFFRGTMNGTSLLAALGLANAMVEYTRPGTGNDIIYEWENFNGYVEEHKDEYAALWARMPSIKDVDLDNIPKLDA